MENDLKENICDNIHVGIYTADTVIIRKQTVNKRQTNKLNLSMPLKNEQQEGCKSLVRYAIRRM